MKPRNNHQTWTGSNYPATCIDLILNPDRRGDKLVGYPIRYPGPVKCELIGAKLSFAV